MYTPYLNNLVHSTLERLRVVYRPDINGFVRRLVHRSGTDLPKVYVSFSYYSKRDAIQLKLLNLNGYEIASPLGFSWSCSPTSTSRPVRLIRRMRGLVLQVYLDPCIKPLP